MPVTGYVVGFMEYWSIGVLEKNQNTDWEAEDALKEMPLGYY